MLIKRYSNRKLYDTDARVYVTLDDVAEAVRRGEDVRVIDHASGADMTALVLAQIVFEQEKKIGGLLPQAMLTRLVRLGNSAISGLRENVSAFMDPMQHAEDEIRRRLGQLQSEGMLSEAESTRLSDLLLSLRLRTMADAPEEEAADPEEMQRLLDQIEQLEKELESLKKDPPTETAA